MFRPRLNALKRCTSKLPWSPKEVRVVVTHCAVAVLAEIATKPVTRSEKSLEALPNSVHAERSWF